MIEIRTYVCTNGHCPYDDWVLSLDSSIRLRVLKRIDRIELGNFGDCESVGEGVYELRMHFGAGYRVYYAYEDDTVVLLLCGGDKSSQQKDIATAKHFWKEEKAT